MRNVILVIVLLLVALPLSSWAGLSIYTEESPPSSFMKDGEMTGISAEIVKEIQKRVGNDDAIQMVPWARGYKEVQEKPNVALFATTRTEEREPLFKWVGPLIRLKWAFFAKKGSGVSIASLDDAKKVGSIGTYKDDAREQFLLKEGFANLDSATDNLTNVRKLMNDRVDLLVSTNLGIVTTAMEAGEDPEQLEEVYVIKQADLYVAFNKQTEDAVVESWKNALSQMVQDGTYATIYKEWLPGQTPPLP